MIGSTRALVGIGSSLGSRYAMVELAVRLLDVDPVLAVRDVARLYRSVGMGPARGWFLNTVVCLDVKCSARQLLSRLQRIEQRLGRRPTVPWGDRTMDLDLLLYGQQVVDEPDLVVPHPAMSDRAFVLRPAAEIAGDWTHPKFGVPLSTIPLPDGGSAYPVGVLLRTTWGNQ